MVRGAVISPLLSRGQGREARAVLQQVSGLDGSLTSAVLFPPLASIQIILLSLFSSSRLQWFLFTCSSVTLILCCFNAYTFFYSNFSLANSSHEESYLKLPSLSHFSLTNSPNLITSCLTPSYVPA